MSDEYPLYAEDITNARPLAYSLVWDLIEEDINYSLEAGDENLSFPASDSLINYLGFLCEIRGKCGKTSIGEKRDGLGEECLLYLDDGSLESIEDFCEVKFVEKSEEHKINEARAGKIIELMRREQAKARQNYIEARDIEQSRTHQRDLARNVVELDESYTAIDNGGWFQHYASAPLRRYLEYLVSYVNPGDKNAGEAKSILYSPPNLREDCLKYLPEDLLREIEKSCHIQQTNDERLTRGVISRIREFVRILSREQERAQYFYWDDHDYGLGRLTDDEDLDWGLDFGSWRK